MIPFFFSPEYLEGYERGFEEAKIMLINDLKTIIKEMEKTKGLKDSSGTIQASKEGL